MIKNRFVEKIVNDYYYNYMLHIDCVEIYLTSDKSN